MTAQLHERLILDGVPMSMTSCPPLPLDRAELQEMDPTALPSGDDRGLTESTACWRRYVATWEIKAGRLYLRAVTGRYRLNAAEPLFADWVNDTLWVPRGDLLEYVHMGFDSVHEFDTAISVRDGVVVDLHVFDNRAGRVQTSR